MPAYYDKEKKYWYTMFYAKDYKGANRKYKKTGFKKKKDAQEYEAEFKKKAAGDVNMSFQSLYELYIEDAKHRLKENSIYTKNNIIRKHVMPFFKDIDINKITPLMIREWQNGLLKQNYKPNMLRCIENSLKCVINYGIKFHGLNDNPFNKSGTVGSRKTAEMNILTLDEFNRFIEYVEKNKSGYYALFSTLFWTGLRIGELLALTWDDVNLKNKTISVNKTINTINGRHVITSPKTEGSNRTIEITSKLAQILESYKKTLYKPETNVRVFNKSKTYIRTILKASLNECGIHQIRIHDFRHSHASLLINAGASILAVSKRLGHEDIKMTLNTYSHLYENENAKLMKKLEEL